jgi:hypothetical protein
MENCSIEKANKLLYFFKNKSIDLIGDGILFPHVFVLREDNKILFFKTSSNIVFYYKKYYVNGCKVSNIINLIYKTINMLKINL